MSQHRDGSIEKSVRLILLMRMQDRGELTGLSLQDIADKFPDQPHRSTIMRDLRDVDRLRDKIKEMEMK